MPALPAEKCYPVLRKLEHVLIRVAGRHFGVSLTAQQLSLDGVVVEVDGLAIDAAAQQVIVAEAYVSSRYPRAASRRKVQSDLLKLLFIREYLREQHSGYRIRPVLVFSSVRVAQAFESQTWASAAIRRLDVELLTYAITPADITLARIAAARGGHVRKRPRRAK
jgi:hypothetical protein